MSSVQICTGFKRLILVLGMFIFSISCEKAVTFEAPDFRDGYIGTYSTINIRWYPTYVISGGIIWNYDTMSLNAKVFVEEYADSSLLIRFDSSYSHRNIFTYRSDSVFAVLEMPGPYSFVEFRKEDSIYIYWRESNETGREYFGNKD